MSCEPSSTPYTRRATEYHVAKNPWIDYRSYFVDGRKGKSVTVSRVRQEDQSNIIRDSQGWLDLEKSSIADGHVFLEGSGLNSLTNHLVENARTEPLIANPYVDKTDILWRCGERGSERDQLEV